MAKTDRATQLAKIQADIPDNNEELITPEKERGVMRNEADSALYAIDDTGSDGEIPFTNATEDGLNYSSSFGIFSGVLTWLGDMVLNALRVDTITNKAGTGAPNFSQGLTASDATNGTGFFGGSLTTQRILAMDIRSRNTNLDFEMTSRNVEANRAQRIRWYTSTDGSNRFQRWQIGKAGGTESGSNAGSNFQIGRSADDGSFIDNPIDIPRDTGVPNFPNGATSEGDEVATLKQGSWSPSFLDGTVSGTGYYQKVGLHVTCSFDIDSISGSGSLRFDLNQLPFTMRSGTTVGGSAYLGSGTSSAGAAFATVENNVRVVFRLPSGSNLNLSTGTSGGAGIFVSYMAAS